MKALDKTVKVVADYSRDGAAIYALEQAIEDNGDCFSVKGVDNGFSYSYGSENGYHAAPAIEAEGSLVVEIDVSGARGTPEDEKAVLEQDFHGVAVHGHACGGGCDRCRRPCEDEELPATVGIVSVAVAGKTLVVTLGITPGD